MFSSIKSVALSGITGVITSVEADVRNGLPSFNMVGFLSTQVKESGDRVRAAILNSGFKLEPKKILINFSPADIKKDGTTFDLAVAMSILSTEIKFNEKYIEETAFAGELSLNGGLRPVNGILSMVCAAKDAGIRRFILPAENYSEAALVEGIGIIPAESLLEVKEIVKNELERNEEKECVKADRDEIRARDFSEIQGQENAKRAIEIAVSGMHNIIMIGPAGSGKSLLAGCIPSIMPDMSREESLETTKIHSVCGALGNVNALISKRPFRTPHNSISVPALVGGGAGNNIKAGEISLAHNGVLFLDELPEFSKQTIEILRQPIEEKKITIGRVKGTVTYPADFLLAAAMNPCKCGFYPDRRLCGCDENKVKNYLMRVSRPIIDRFDIVTEVARVSIEHIKNKNKSEASETIRKRVCSAREIQEERFRGMGIHFNSQMDNKLTEAFCPLDNKAKKLLEAAYEKNNMSLRGYYRILKVARTISDLNEKKEISEKEMAEAVHYREMAERFWR